MIISDTKNFIFIHIPKTGGMSIRQVLEPYATVNVWEGRIIKGTLKQQNEQLSKHAKARTVKKYTAWNSYFKFAFVRNPWSWLVSGYYYARKDRKDWRHKEARSMQFKEYLIWSLVSNDKRHNILHLGQADFISENNKIIVDYIGKLETISKDFNYICNRINVPMRIPHMNKTMHKAYRKYYDNETRKLVAVNFEKDIKLFNYKF